jgi:hypothetical protein
MKMLFFSADRLEVETVSRAFCDAGIACETRDGGPGRALFPTPSEAELWIRRDKDAYKALMLCVEQGIGFAKRSAISDDTLRYPSWDIDDMEEDQDEEEMENQGAEKMTQ